MQLEHVAGMEEIINSYIILVGKPKRKKLLGESKFEWENNTVTC
jgi:hypothetical protein